MLSRLFSIMLCFALSLSIGLAQEIRVVKYEGLIDAIEQKGDKLTIVNFWATWCGPCVEEIPHFVVVFNKYKTSANLDIIFVSLDRATHTKEVDNFVKEHKMPGDQLLLDDVKRFNEWIPKIHPDWEGGLPATGFYRDGKLLEFQPNMLSEKELIQIIENLK